jgi:DnaJ-class molecular chaperone
MKQEIVKCKTCDGKGVLIDQKGIKQCPNCEGTGVPLFDEDYDNASSLTGDGYYGEEDEDE